MISFQSRSMMRRRRVVTAPVQPGSWIPIIFTVGIDDASSRKCAHPCKMEVRDGCFDTLLRLISVRKEMQYMLHSRRKAEIEVLYTQNKPKDNGSGAFGETYACSNAKQPLNPFGKVIPSSSQKVFPNIATRITAFEDSSHLDIFSSSSQLKNSDMRSWPTPDHSESKCSPHALLVRYLEEKITGFIGAAMHRKRI